MSSDENNEYTYANGQSEASAPATSTNTNAAGKGTAQPSAPPYRSSSNDFTLVDNNLYE